MFPIQFKSMGDQERHDYILKTYVLNKNAADARRHKRDIDVIKEHHRFLWDTDDPSPDTWEERLARRYYDKLFKEYCIADLTRYKENKVAMRWRTEAEVVAGTGQFQCGNRKCEQREQLRSWEVNFAYQEQGLRKNALVKLRLCAEHSAQLNYTSRKRELKRLKHAERQQAKDAKRNRRKEGKAARKGQPSSSSEMADRVEMEEEEEEAASGANEQESQVSSVEEMEQVNETVDTSEENVWAHKPEVETEMNTRETDFERYLEDLLL